jgi:protein gp37
MGKDTKIPWAHHTFSPWWGCVKISEECENCYAFAWDRRLGGDHWGPNAPRRFFGDNRWALPLKWDRAAAAAGERHRVFCASMADVFEHRDDMVGLDINNARNRMFGVIQETPNLDWLILTKRPDNFRRFLPMGWYHTDGSDRGAWPNVWLGVSAGNQQRWDERVPILLDTPAVCRFVSYEPALGPIDCGDNFSRYREIGTELLPAPDWLIAGDESGPRARPPAPLDWYRSLRDECHAANVAFFLKQFVRDRVKIELPKLDGRRHAEFPTPNP